METVILAIHVLAAAALIGLVLIQQGQGADAGAAFGSGASQTLFGSRGAGSFFTRATTLLALVFFLTSLALAWSSAQNVKQESVIDRVGVTIDTDAELPPGLFGEEAEQKGAGGRAPADIPVIPE